MTELDQLITAAYNSEGRQEDANKVYLALLRATLFVPTSKEPPVESEEPFRPLFAQIEDRYFMLGFDSAERLQAWAGEESEQMSFVELSGRDVIAGIHDEVYFILNLGTDFYKEFSPDEIKHLKKIVGRLDQLI